VTVINRNAATRRPTPPRKWGWMEVFVLSQSFFPAMLFIPGLSSLRLLTRVAAFLIAPLFWLLIYCYGKHLRGGENFAVRPLLLGVSGWLGLCLIHPDTNWPIAGIAQIGLYVSIFSPVSSSATPSALRWVSPRCSDPTRSIRL
jgi:hypothetical protein